MWFKVDDSFYDHPKTIALSDAAMALWLRSGTWSARNGTDGRIPANLPGRMCEDPERAIRELMEAGLWEMTKSGMYRFHDWSVYQPDRSVRHRSLIGRRKAATRTNHIRWHLGRGVTDPSCTLCELGEDRSSDRSSVADSESVSDSVPSRSAIAPVTRKDQDHVGAPVRDLLQDVVTHASPRDARTPTREPAHVRTRPPGRSGEPHEAVMAVLSATPSEARAVVARLLGEFPAENPIAFVNAAINAGRAQQALTEHRAAVRRADRAEWAARRKLAAECGHGIPGGDWPHFDPPHTPVCLNCRLEARRAAG